MGRHIVAAFMCAAFSLQLFANAHAQAAAPDVHVFSCQIISGKGNVPLGDEIGLAVRFENMSSSPLRSIVWRARYGPALVDFIDDGTFSPQTRIDNFLLFEAGHRTINGFGYISGNLWNAPDMFGPYGSSSDPENCTIARAISFDGSLWVNPAAANAQPFVFPSPQPHASATASPAPVKSGPVEISQCDFSIGGIGYVAVRFSNTDARPMHRVVFRVPYKTGAIDFADEGTFSTGVAVSHTLHATLPHSYHWTAYYDLEHPLDNCAVARVDYADGSSWQNPAMGATPAPLPSPPADAMPVQELLGTHVHWQLHGFPTPVPSPTPGR